MPISLSLRNCKKIKTSHVPRITLIYLSLNEAPIPWFVQGIGVLVGRHKKPASYQVAGKKVDSFCLFLFPLLTY